MTPRQVVLAGSLIVSAALLLVGCAATAVPVLHPAIVSVPSADVEQVHLLATVPGTVLLCVEPFGAGPMACLPVWALRTALFHPQYAENE